MKKLFLIISILAVSIGVFGQHKIENRMPADNIWPFFIGLGGGVSYPLNDFASTDLNNPSAGFAQKGKNFMACFDYDFSNPFGGTLQGESVSHPLNTSAIARELGIPKVSAANYTNNCYMVGMMFMIASQEDNDGFTLGVKALYGVSNMTLPEMNFNGASSRALSSSSRVYGASAEARVFIWKRLTVFVNTEYLISKHDFGSLQTGSSVRELILPSNMVNIAFGLGIMF